MKNLTIASFLVLSLLINTPLALADIWQAPPASPPNGNTSKPLDEGDSNQTKTGSLTVNGGLTLPNLTVTGQPSLNFGDALIFFNASQQSSLNVNSSITTGQGLLSSVASIVNTNIGQAAHSLYLSNSGNGLNGSSVALYAQQINGGWAGYFNGPLGVTGNTGLTGNLTVGGVVTISGGAPGAGKVLTSDANGLGSWQNAAGSFWTDAGAYIRPAATANFQIAESNGELQVINANVVINGGHLDLENYGLIRYSSENQSPPVLLADQVMIGRKYCDQAGAFCDPPAQQLGVDLANNENLIFGRVRETTSGNNDTTQSLLRLQWGDGLDSEIDRFKVDLSGNTDIAGSLTVTGDAWNQGLTRTNYLWVINGSPAGYDQVGDAYFAGDVFVGDTIKIAGGSPEAGKVLTSDANGLGSWQNAAGSSKWTDAGAISYLTATGDNLAIGGTDAAADFYFDVSANQLKVNNGGDFTGLRDQYLETSRSLIIGLDDDNNDATSKFLSIRTNGSATDLLKVNDNGTTEFGSASIAVAAGENLIYGVLDNASAGNLILMENESGNEKFKVDKDGNTTLAGDITIQGGGIVGSNSESVSVGETNNIISFTSNGGERMRIHSNNYVGLGLTTPTAMLDINGTIETTSGSVSTPAYSFGTDTNTGIYRSAIDTLNFSTGGTNRMSIDSTGLAVATGDFEVRQTAGTNYVYLDANTTAANQNSIYVNSNNTAGSFIKLEQGAGAIKFQVDKSGNATTTGDITVGGNDIKNSDGVSAIQFSGGNVIIRLGQ